MLQRLYVKNVALISEADIEFGEKLNILSGETGAGKSVILDSIDFVLGSKADKSMIRFGEREAYVRAEFSVEKDSEALKKLEELDIESDGEIIITRKFNLDGKGSIKVNGNTVTATMLKEIAQRIVDVHGQSEHFYLLSEDNQLKVIDGIAGEKALEIKAELSSFISQKRTAKAKIAELGGDMAERERKIDLLRYQIDEIERADIKEGEFEALSERQKIILNAEKILSALNSAHSAFSDDGGCLDAVSTAKHSVGALTELSDEYSALFDRIESLYADASDISEQLSDMADDVSFDGREAEEIDERITLLKSLRKKYGVDEGEILTFLENAKIKYDELIGSAENIEKLNAQVQSLNKQIYSCCRKLTSLRQVCAQKFSREVESELKTLNIQNARFEVSFKEYDENSANLQSSNGSDSVSFAFSANKGEPLKPLSKVISGGEMSRFMLAIKTCLKDVNGISTYIFDEIDAGISGYTAKMVAEKFIKISQNTQIIAVSHLPQICAAGDCHLFIYKVEENGKTYTKVKRLSVDERVDELVRLTGGGTSEAAKAHARELLDSYVR